MSDEREPTPQFEDVSVKFLGLTKAKAAGVFGVLALITVNMLVFFLVRNVQANHERIAQNGRALAYTCSTTTVLAGLVGFVVTQNEAALKNKRLHLSSDQIAAIDTTIARFDRARSLLAANGACRELRETMP